VSWPGKRAGFVVVVVMVKEEHLDNHDIYLLDEYESWDVRELVRKCGTFDYIYHRPRVWIGDRTNNAADYSIREMNIENTLPAKKSQEQRRMFSLSTTPLLEMNYLYQYILAQLQNLLKEDTRQLFLKDSTIKNYIRDVEASNSEVAKYELGEYPAIEALAFSVIEMRRFGQLRDSDSYVDDMTVANSYATQSVI